MRRVFYSRRTHLLLMSNRGSIYSPAKQHRINQQDLHLLFQKMLQNELHM